MYINQSLEDKIVKDWTLSELDQLLIRKLHKNHRVWFSVQLCALRLFGRFLDSTHLIDPPIISYICNQLELGLMLSLDKPPRKATYIEQRKLIFEHLGFSNFSNKVKKLFEQWAQNKVSEGIISNETIYDQGSQFLLLQKVILPSPKELKRIINSIFSKQLQKLFLQLFKKADKYVIKQIDEILITSDKSTNSLFQQFKEYPPSATITSLDKYLHKYQKISSFELDKIDIQAFSKEFIEHLHKLGKYYSADAIKRFNQEKRYAIVIGFLIETKKILLDYIIQMHDQYISNICRECSNIHDSLLKQHRNKHDRALEKIISFIDQMLIDENGASEG